MNMYQTEPAGNGAAAELYVAPYGSDGPGSGTRARPFGTVEAAQNAVREMIRSGGLTGDVRIVFRGGTYYRRLPVVIGAADCDSRFRIIYTAYEGEEARFVGGVPVTGWTEPDEEGVCSADLPLSGQDGRIVGFALYENGVRLTPARETDWRGKPVRDISRLQAVYGSDTSWFGEVLKVRSFDGSEARTDIVPCPWSGGLRYLQGAREYISEPGEWAVEGAKIYCKPKDPARFLSGEIVLGTADNLFLIRGEEGNPVRNIVLEGLKLEMNDFGENLAAHAREGNVTAEYESNLKGLVCLRNAESAEVRNCRMANAGYMAAVLIGSVRNCVISGCDIRNTGYAGLFLIGENPGSLNYCSRNNTVSDNRIRDAGESVSHGAGIYLMNSGENRIVHNDISRVPRYGISLKGIRYGVFPDNGLGDVSFEDHWAYNQTSDNYIGYNRICNTGMRSGDGGGIEGWGMGRGNRIDHNVICGAYRGPATTGWRGHGIFLDDAAHHTLVTNNILYDEGAPAVNAGIFIKSIDNVVVNNVFDVGYARNGAADIAPYICPAGDSVFERNIVFSDTGGTIREDGTFDEAGNGDRVMITFSDNGNSTGTPSLDSLRFMNGNLYFNGAGRALFSVNGRLLTAEEWKNCPENTRRYDADSISEDPMFTDAEHRDYRLQPDSPARKLGIESVDGREAGLLPDFPFADGPEDP